MNFWNSVSPGTGACGTALDRGERVIIEDIERSEAFVGTRSLEVQRKAGVRAVQSTPIVTRAGRRIGLFSTHHGQPHRPDARELRMMDLLARQAADIVDVWETNQNRTAALGAAQRANQRLKELANERRIFEALIENSSDFIGIADPHGKPTYVNPAGRSMVGLSAEHPIEETQILDYYPREQRAFARDVIVKAMLERGHWEGDTSFRHWQKRLRRLPYRTDIS